MKKIVSVLLIFCCLIAFASCVNKQGTNDKVMETAETFVELTGSAGALTIDKSVAKTLLEVYPKETLGLSKDIYEYELKLSPTRFSDRDACLVEAFNEGDEKPEGTFVILDNQCFVYDKKTQKYLLLTVDKGAVEAEISKESVSGEGSSDKPAFMYDENNNKNLHKKFDSYSKEKLGLEKEITEYILVVPGVTTTAKNGETVFVVRLHEKTGEAINKTVAFNEDGNYVFDYEANKYVKL